MQSRLSDWGKYVILLAVLLSGCSAFTDQNVAAKSGFERRVVGEVGNRKGVHLLLADTFMDWPEDVWDEHLEAARWAVGEGGFVVQLVRADDLDVDRWQRFMDLCGELGLAPIVRLATVANEEIGGWDAPPQDRDGGYRGIAREYADFLVALEWPTEQHFVIVGNEPNHGNEWGGMPKPDEYARFLIDVADELHRRDAGAVVLNAGLDAFAPHTNGEPIGGGSPLMDSESFIDGMVAAQPNVFSYVDVWASHAYPLGAFVEPPEVMAFGVDYLNGAENGAAGEPPEGIFNRGVLGYEWELWKLSKLGVEELPVMVTETGWRHTEAGYPDVEVVAGYLERAWCDYWVEDARVLAVVPFAFDGDPVRWGHSNWLRLGEDGRVLGLEPMVGVWGAGDCG